VVSAVTLHQFQSSPALRAGSRFEQKSEESGGEGANRPRRVFEGEVTRLMVRNVARFGMDVHGERCGQILLQQGP